jgi:hypothetical protein
MAIPTIKLATSDPPPPRSPERQALADIIERRNALMREIENANAAHVKARAHRYDAQCCLEKARADSEAATDIDSFIEAVSSGDVAKQLKAAAGPSDSIERLERDVERWQNTETACRARATELERDAQCFPVYAQRHIDDVIKTEANVSALLNGFEEMWSEINRRLSILSWLHGNKRIKDEDVQRVFAAIRYNLIEDSAAVDAWQRAIAELARDADTRLPI